MFRRLSVLMITALALFAVAIPSASAQDTVTRTTGKNANAYWTQVDNTPLGGEFGNVHVGSLYAYETATGVADAYMYIEDWDCPAGDLPSWGHDGPEGACVYVGGRHGEGLAMSFSINRKLTTATLSGTMTVFGGGGHDGPGDVVGSPSVSITWTGYGSTSKSVSTYRYTSDGFSFSERYRSTDRQATMSGNIGPMGFAPDLSGGSISKFVQRSRY